MEVEVRELRKNQNNHLNSFFVLVVVVEGEVEVEEVEGVEVGLMNIHLSLMLTLYQTGY